MLSALLILGLSAGITPEVLDTLRTQCITLGTTFNQRSFSFKFIDYQGNSRSSTTKYKIDSDTCASEFTHIKFDAVKVGTPPVRITFNLIPKESGLYLEAPTLGNCPYDSSFAYITTLKNFGYVMSPEIETKIYENYRLSLCPALVEALKGEILTSLQGG